MLFRSILVANKCDLDERKWEVEMHRGREVSIKSNHNFCVQPTVHRRTLSIFVDFKVFQVAFSVSLTTRFL